MDIRDEFSASGIADNQVLLCDLRSFVPTLWKELEKYLKHDWYQREIKHKHAGLAIILSMEFVYRQKTNMNDGM